MGAILNDVVVRMEDNMRRIVEEGSERAAKSLWVGECATVIPSQSRQEMLAWFLFNCGIEDLGDEGGTMYYKDVVEQTMSVTARNYGVGLEIPVNRLTDLDGNGAAMGAGWSREAAAQSQLYPQKQIATLINAGTSGLAYDGVAFFSSSHPLNPKDSSLGTYSNTVSAKIDSSVSIDVALANMAAAYKQIVEIKGPDGATQRGIVPSVILVPPALFARALQLTNARFLAQAAASGGGSSDIEGLLEAMNFMRVVQCPELGAAFGGSDSVWYIVADNGSELGPLVWVEREPSTITFYSGDDGLNVDLSRQDKLVYHCKGRGKAAYGHPFLMFRCS